MINLLVLRCVSFAQTFEIVFIEVNNYSLIKLRRLDSEEFLNQK